MKWLCFSNPNDMSWLNGAIWFVKWREPSPDWVSIYFDVWDEMNKVLSKVEQAGWRVYLPRTSVWKYGFIAMITDTEGNRIWLN